MHTLFVASMWTLSRLKRFQHRLGGMCYRRITVLLQSAGCRVGKDRVQRTPSELKEMPQVIA
jgi:hypothetical protein